MRMSYVAIFLESKTNGKHTLRLDIKSYEYIKKSPGFMGFCIQSTNAKKDGCNPSLYPCVYGRDPNTLKRYVKQVHRFLIPIIPHGFVIDHKDGDTFNNEFQNLEIVTRGENTRRAQKGRNRK